MAKKKAVPQKRSQTKNSLAEPASKELKMIDAPDAPAVMHSAEVGAHVALDQAIREKVRLYPQAMVNEIVAMFELEGFKVSPAAVTKVKEESR